MRVGVGSSSTVVSCFGGDEGHMPPDLPPKMLNFFMLNQNLKFRKREC